MAVSKLSLENPFEYKGDILSGVSLNTVLVAGVYRTGQNLTDSPIASPWGALIVFAPPNNTSTASAIQMLIDQNGGVYARRADKAWNTL